MRFEYVQVGLRNRRFGELGALQEAIPGLDRVDAWNDRNSYPRLSYSLYPIDENLHIVEHLCEDDGRAGLDLLLQPLELKSEFLMGKGHMLREPCDCDLEVVPMVLSDMSNKIDSVSKATLNSCPGILTSGGVAAKSENVPAAIYFGFL